MISCLQNYTFSLKQQKRLKRHDAAKTRCYSRGKMRKKVTKQRQNRVLHSKSVKNGVFFDEKFGGEENGF